MDIPCDSGYGSAEWEDNDEVLDNLEKNIDEHLNEMEESPLSLDRVSEEESGATNNTTKEDVDDEESFQDWLKKVAECLEGRKKGDPEKMEAVVTEKLTEDERCMKIARSVLDEETVLDMVKTFLQFTKVIDCHITSPIGWYYNL